MLPTFSRKPYSVMKLVFQRIWEVSFISGRVVYKLCHVVLPSVLREPRAFVSLRWRRSHVDRRISPMVCGWKFPIFYLLVISLPSALGCWGRGRWLFWKLLSGTVSLTAGLLFVFWWILCFFKLSSISTFIVRRSNCQTWEVHALQHSDHLALRYSNVRAPRLSLGFPWLFVLCLPGAICVERSVP